MHYRIQSCSATVGNWSSRRGFFRTWCRNELALPPQHGCRREAGSKRPDLALARLHPDGAVQANGLAVEHGVLDDMLHQGSVFVGLAEPGRKWRLPAE